MKSYNRILTQYINNQRLRIPIFERLIVDIKHLEVMNNILRQLIDKPVQIEVDFDTVRLITANYIGKQEKLRTLKEKLETENETLLAHIDKTKELKEYSPISKLWANSNV